MKFFSILIFYLVFFSKSYSIEVQKDLQKSSLQIIPSKQILKYENESLTGILKAFPFMIICFSIFFQRKTVETMLLLLISLPFLLS